MKKLLVIAAFALAAVAPFAINAVNAEDAAVDAEVVAEDEMVVLDEDGNPIVEDEAHIEGETDVDVHVDEEHHDEEHHDEEHHDEETH